MKPCTSTMALILAPVALLAQSWIQIDLNQAGAAAGGGIWNVLNTPASSVGYLVDTNGTPTTATIAVSADWQDSTTTSSKGAYATTVFGNAAADYFYLRRSISTNGTVTISGLQNGVPYAVQLASSYINGGTPSIADFRVNGVFGTGAPTGQAFSAYADGYLNGSIITWSPVYAVGGQFVISVVCQGAPADSTAHLDAIRIGPAADLPGAPTLTRAVAVSDTEAEAAWSGDFPEGTTFLVSCDGGAIARTLNCGTSRSAFVTGLIPATTYSVRVAAQSAQGPGTWSTPITLTTQPAPSVGKKFEIDLNTVTSAANWICLAGPTSQSAGGLTFTFANFLDTASEGFAGRFVMTLFSAAANDYFYVKGDAGGLTGTMTISGLPGKAYSVQLCSSANTSATSRKADFRVNGEFSPLSPTGAQYNSMTDGFDNARLMTWRPVRPVTGTITVTVTTASSTYYGILNGLRLVELPVADGSVVLIR